MEAGQGREVDAHETKCPASSTHVIWQGGTVHAILSGRPNMAVRSEREGTVSLSNRVECGEHEGNESRQDERAKNGGVSVAMDTLEHMRSHLLSICVWSVSGDPSPSPVDVSRVCTVLPLGRCGHES